MLSLTPIVRSKKETDFVPLEIRIIANRSVAYLRTRWMVKRVWVQADGTITDKAVAKAVARYIDDKMEELNRHD